VAGGKAKIIADIPVPDGRSGPSNTNMEDITRLLNAPAKIAGQQTNGTKNESAQTVPGFAVTKTVDWSIRHEDKVGADMEPEQRSIRDEMRPSLTMDSKAARFLGMGGGSGRGGRRREARGWGMVRGLMRRILSNCKPCRILPL
jgi:hypothetical protein